MRKGVSRSEGFRILGEKLVLQQVEGCVKCMCVYDKPLLQTAYIIHTEKKKKNK